MVRDQQTDEFSELFSEDTTVREAARERQKNDFGRRVYTRMLSMGLSQAELARKAGLDRARISSYIHGKTLPTDTMLTKLAAALKLKPTDLLPMPLLDERRSFPRSGGPTLQIEGGRARVTFDGWLPAAVGIQIVQLINDNQAPDGE